MELFWIAMIILTTLPWTILAAVLWSQPRLSELTRQISTFSTATMELRDEVRSSGTYGPDHSGWISLKADVSKAHRRVKVLRTGWRFQVATNKGKYWVNKVSTYGMASAQFY